jgi:GWxTD domain-containing protein
MRLLFIIILAVLIAQPGKAMDISVQHAAFQSQGKPYVELSFYILGSSLIFEPVEDGLNQASVDVTLMFLQGETVIQFDRFRLVSNRMKIPGDLYHISRYALQEGEYTLEVVAVDGVDTTNMHEVTSTVIVNFPDAGVAQSGISLLASAEKDTLGHPLAKNGIIMEPIGFHYYDPHINTLVFYNEVYRTDELGEDWIVHYAVYEPADTAFKAPVMERFKRKNGASVVPLLMKMDISGLPSGRYRFVCEVWRLDKTVASRASTIFFRSNPARDLAMTVEMEHIQIGQFVDTLGLEQLDYALRALVPRLIGSDIETANFLLEDKKPKYMRYFLYNYWVNAAPHDPGGTFQQYMDVARAVDRKFYTGYRRGFETDRGYIFLKYGKPDDLITIEDEVDAPPYEIWTYYSLRNSRQSNVKFLYYNPSLMRNGYELLHSTARGERQNPRWESVLYGNIAGQLPASNFLDGGGIPDGINRNARRHFNDN